MGQNLRVRELRLFRLSLPMRLRFEHAAAARDTADPLIVRLSAAAPHAHLAGYGESLARPYVTGETADSAANDILQLLGPTISAFRPESFSEALEFIEALPFEDNGRVINAARAAVELALLDLACRAFQRRPADVAGWMGLTGFGPPGSIKTATYSGIVVGKTPQKLKWLLRLQRAYGLSDFKLKVAVEDWESRVRWATDVLGAAMRRRRVTLRVDANGGWSLAEANEALETLERAGVCCVEQPLSDAEDEDLPFLAEQTHCDIAVDESLLTMQDAERLTRGGGVKVFNIRIGKNGGFMPALRLARVALAAGIDVQLGCLVGETSILSAAGGAFLETCPRVRFVEGAFGRFLLKRDVVRNRVQFGRRGSMRPRPDFGWGVDVDEAALQEFSAAPPQAIHL